MFEPNFLSIIYTRGIMVSSLGFEPNILGSNPNSDYCTELDQDIDVSTIDHKGFHCSS